ncbi:MAG: response regulator transcription factor [Acidobacteriia bacterium]|nr:response regulator transcription factor [Terriglobia bacterium]
MRVLVVEDARPMAETLAKGLRERGYAVDVACDGETALQQAEINRYDAIVLDIMLPRRDGLAVCRALRGQGLSVPILMLTARDAVEDRVAGLDAGADDYLIKPFAFKELLARLRALLRRHSELRPLRFKLADLTLDTASQEVKRGGRMVRLTAKEYALLEYLVLHAGEVVSRERISDHVWDESFDPFSNLIEVYIQRLRKKIDEGAQVKLIHTRRGAGYLLRAQDSEQAGG